MPENVRQLTHVGANGTMTFQDFNIPFSDVRIAPNPPLMMPSLGLTLERIRNIPDELKRLNQWVCWRYEDRKNGRTKVPVHGATGNRIDATDSSFWSSFETALNYASMYSGIGFALPTNHRYIGIDVDRCIDPDSESILSPVGMSVYEILHDTYCEVTPSGNGLRFFLRNGNRNAMEFRRKKNTKLKIEMYREKRFLTVTGAPFLGIGRPIQQAGTQFQKFLDLFSTASEKEPTLSSTLQRPCPATAAEVIQKAISAKNRDKFLSLFTYGSLNEYNRDWSSADQALCNHLAFWCGPDPNRIDEIFRQSFLCREKWLDRKDYRDMTIRKAIERTGENFYDWHGNNRNTIDPSFLAEIAPYAMPATTPLATSTLATPTLTFAGSSVSDLWNLADTPVGWVVEGVFSRDQPTVIGAPKKCLKTTILLDLAISLSTKTPWLGYWKVPRQFKVLFITGEASTNGVMRKLRKAAGFRGVTKDQLRSLHIEAKDFPKFKHAGHLHTIANDVRTYGFEIVIVDPLYCGLDGTVQAGNLFEMGSVLRDFKSACNPASIILSHHTKKSSQGNRYKMPELDDLSQAGVAEFFGNYFLLGRLSKYAGDHVHDLGISFGGRDEQFGAYRLRFDEDDWTAQFSEGTADPSKPGLNEPSTVDCERIVTTLRGYPEGLSENQLASKSNTNPGNHWFKNVLTSLVAAGTIESLPQFKPFRSKECQGYRLANQPTAMNPQD